MPRKLRNDSPFARVMSSESGRGGLLPPKQIKLSEEELDRFAAYLNAKPADEWREFDLYQLARAIQYETKVEACERFLEENGYTDGLDRQRPQVRVSEIYQRRAVKLYTILGLNLSPRRITQPEGGAKDNDAPVQLK